MTVNSIMRISSNQTLDFMKGSSRVNFSLVRTKIIFNAYFNNNLLLLGGELIDVSIGHKNDSGMEHYFAHIDSNVKQYYIKSVDGDFTFKAPSLTYLIEDIEKILFKDQVYPWDDIKYAKRIKRLLFMYFCMLLININLSYGKKIKYLKYIEDNIFAKLIGQFKSGEVKDNINIFLDNSRPDEPASVYPFRVLLDHLNNLLTMHYDQNKFQDYCQLIFDNISELIKLFGDMMKRCSKKGIDENDIIEGTTLWGGDDLRNKKKYYKYKNKYLKLKK